MKLNNQSGGLARLRIARHPIARAVAGALMPAGLLLALAPNVLAGPQGGLVHAGQASIAQSGTLTTVQQASARAVIDWRSFNVGAAEAVRFDQPSSSAWVLNRVVGNDASSILGRITANGQVLLINPNGIVFGRSAQVDVGGLVASTANVSNADFMAGRLRFAEPGKPGAKVENQGRITVADGGLAALVGYQVANSGFINARLGKVVLAAGDAFTLDLYGDRLVNLIVEPEALARLVDSAGVPLAARVDQQGSIVAEGGIVQISAATAQRLVDNAINVGGTIRATSFDAAPGLISLRGDSQTRLSLAGTLDVSGVRGGTVELTARAVRVADTAKVDASGALGGGRVEIGGGWQGSGTLMQARDVQVARGATIDVSARDAGSGGSVALWSAGDMRFEGSVRARAGEGGGDGGRVEVSGKHGLVFEGDVDAAAARGHAGRLLLDPRNLVIDANSGDASLPGTGSGDATVRASTINRVLRAGTTVDLLADNDITVNAGAQIDARGTGNTAGAGLGLTAGRSIDLNGNVILDNGVFTAVARTGTFAQASGAVVATGTGGMSIDAVAGIVATNLIGSGALHLGSSGGTVRVTQALGASGSGGTVTRFAALDVLATGIAFEGDAFVQGAATLVASQGGISTRALDSRASLTLQANGAVTTAALLTPGDVQVSSATGAVSLGPVASQATDASGFAGSKVASLTIRAAGAVALAGAATGAGGLRIDGATGAGSRAGSATFDTAGVFSSGELAVNMTGNVSFGAASGIEGGAAVTIDSSAGSISTGAGAIKAAGAARLTAGSAITVGAGGVSSGSTSDHALDITAGATLTLGGKLQSTGGANLVASGAGADVLAHADVQARGVSVSAGGRFEQTLAGKVIDAGSGALAISSAGKLDATNLFSTGDVTLTSTGANVKVAGALGRADATTGAVQRIGSLSVIAATDVELSSGALVTRTTSITAGKDAGVGALTLGATLDSGGRIELVADNGISTKALMAGSNAAVDITSTKAGADSVRLGAVSGSIAGASQTLSGTSPKAGALTVRSAGDVTLDGGAAVSSLTVAGTAAGSRSGGSFTLTGGTIYASGDVSVTTGGPLALNGTAGADSGTALVLDSSAALTTGSGALRSGTTAKLAAGGALTVGSGGVLAQATGNNALRLDAGGTVTLNGKLDSANGQVAVNAAGATSDVLANAGILTKGLSIGAGHEFVQGSTTLALDAGSGALGITAAGKLDATNLFSTGDVTLTSTSANVKVAGALGRADATTGAVQRIGSLTVNAATDVELSSGALVTRTTSITAGKDSDVGALTLGATLDSGGRIELVADNGISTKALMAGATAAVDVTSTKTGADSVRLGAVSGSISGTSQTLSSASPKAGALTVRSAGDVTLEGGAAVASVTVAGNSTATDSRSGGSFTLTGGTVYASGDVSVVSAGTLALNGTAGADSGTALVLGSNAAITTGSGALSSGTTAKLAAGGALTVGSGGVLAQATGANALRLDAGGTVTLNGKLDSANGQVAVNAAGATSDVLANAGILAKGLSIGAGSQFVQGSSTLAIDAGSGALGITSAGKLDATNLFSSGDVTLTSTGANVKVAGALGRADATTGAVQRIGSLTVNAATDVELSSGAVVTRTTSITAGKDAGIGALTLGATLDSGAHIELVADNGISTKALMAGSDAAVDITSTKTGADSVRLGAVSGSISGASQTLSSASPKAGALTMRSAGDVTLDGGAAVASLAGAGTSTAAGSRSGGSFTLTGGTVYASGDVSVTTGGPLALNGTAGADSGTALVLDSSAALTTGSGALRSGTTAKLAAAGALTVGSGGVLAQATGNNALRLDAAGTVTLIGKLDSANGQVAITAAGAASDVLANAGILAKGLSIGAGHEFVQGSATLALDAGGGALRITSAGKLDATNLFSTGDVTLTSTGANVKVAGALGRADATTGTVQRIGSLTVNAATDVELSSGAVVTRTSTITAGKDAGIGALTLGATLDSGGRIELVADNGISTQALMAGASSAIDVTSTKAGADSVRLGAVSGSISGTSQTLSSASPKAGALTVRSVGDVTMDGGAAVSSLAVAGISTAAGSRSGGSFTLTGGTVYASGNVGVHSGADVRIDPDVTNAPPQLAGIESAGLLVLDATGALSTGRGQVKASGNIELTGSTLTIGRSDAAGTFVLDPAHPNAACTSGCGTGGVTSNAAMTLTALQGDIKAYAKLQTAGGTIQVTTPANVELNHVSTWQSSGGDMNSGELIVNGADVVLKQALGGLSTGFDLYSQGYQRTARPSVGRVVIDATGSVQLNGLNLDGNNSAADTQAGLSVHAAARLISNDQIAVNKGAVELVQERRANATPVAVDGVYLGNNVYSRGYDFVGTGGRTRLGYGITIKGGYIALFDNTKEFADVAKVSDTPSGSYLRNGRIAKIIVANDPANYRDDPATTSVDESAQLQPLSVGASMPAIILTGKLTGVVVGDLNASVPSDRGGALQLSDLLVGYDVWSNTVPFSGFLAGVYVPRWVVGSDLSRVQTVITRDDGQTRVSDGGPLLKILTFRGAADTSSSIPVFDLVASGSSAGVSYSPRNDQGEAPAAVGVDLRGLVRSSQTLPNDPLGTDVRLYPAATVDSIDGRIRMGIPEGWKYQNGWDYATGYSASNPPPTPRPTSPPVALYFLSGTTVDARADGTRIVIGGGPINYDYAVASITDFVATASNSTATIRTNASGQLQGSVVTGGATTFGGAAGANNAGGGFVGIGGFGSNSGGTTAGSATNTNTATGTVVLGAGGNTSGAGTSTNSATGAVVLGTGGNTSGAGTNSTGVGTVVGGGTGTTSGAAGNTASGTDAVAGVSATQVASGSGNSTPIPPVTVEPENPLPPTAVTTSEHRDPDVLLAINPNEDALAEVLLGRRPGADADLGRTGAGNGSSAAVFKKRYRVGTASDASICAPGVLEHRQTGSDARKCEAKK